MLRTRFDRRTILKAAAGGALLLLSGKPFPRVASAGTASPAPEGRLSLFHTHTGERLSVAYRNGSGEYRPEAVSSLNHFLRCHYNQQVTEMDLRVVDFLHAVDGSLGGQNEIHIISGFRSPEYNEKLHREGRGVARSSYHLLGKAIDFRIPGKSLAALRDAALRLREGGVGYYPGAGFVHIDSGRFRTW
ncbi:MAG: YcbK family protein [Candidatus Deferrimicrobiaceae bacterium]